MAEPSTIVKARDFLAEEVGDLDAGRKSQVLDVLSEFMRDIRACLDTTLAQMSVAHPECPVPCPTCAFNPKTDGWKGFGPTAYGLARALHRGTNFFCHWGHPERRDNIFDLTKVTPCIGFTSVKVSYPVEAKRIANKAMEQIEAIVGKK